MKFRSMLLGLAAAAVVAPGAQAEEETSGLFEGDLSANVAVTTDYRFRGISQTDLLPAIQGGIDYSLPLTNYLSVNIGTWASNVDFNDGDDAHIEMDFYAGLSGTIDKFSWSFQFIYYHYPGAESGTNYDYLEIAPSVGYDFGFMSTTAGLNYSPDYFGASGDAVYLYGEVSVPLPIPTLQNLQPTFNAHLGYQVIDRNAVFGTPDYLTWSLGVSVTIEGFELSLAYVDTDLSQRQCFGGSDLCNATAIFTVSKTF